MRSPSQNLRARSPSLPSKDFWAYPISPHSPFRHRLPWEEFSLQSGNARLRPHVQPLSEAADFAMQHALHAGVQEIHELSPVVFKLIRAGEKCRTPHPRHRERTLHDPMTTGNAPAPSSRRPPVPQAAPPRAGGANQPGESPLFCGEGKSPWTEGVTPYETILRATPPWKSPPFRSRNLPLRGVRADPAPYGIRPQPARRTRRFWCDLPVSAPVPPSPPSTPRTATGTSPAVPKNR